MEAINSTTRRGRVIEGGRLTPTLDTSCKVGVLAVSSLGVDVKHQNGRRIKDEGDPSFTLTSRDRHGVVLDTGEVRVRRLTPRECFRLQGFPDDYFDRAAQVCSDSQLYKQAGNAVTVNVVYQIAKRLTL